MDAKAWNSLQRDAETGCCLQQSSARGEAPTRHSRLKLPVAAVTAKAKRRYMSCTLSTALIPLQPFTEAHERNSLMFFENAGITFISSDNKNSRVHEH